MFEHKRQSNVFPFPANENFHFLCSIASCRVLSSHSGLSIESPRTYTSVKTFKNFWLMLMEDDKTKNEAKEYIMCGGWRNKGWRGPKVIRKKLFLLKFQFKNKQTENCLNKMMWWTIRNKCIYVVLCSAACTYEKQTI